MHTSQGADNKPQKQRCPTSPKGRVIWLWWRIQMSWVPVTLSFKALLQYCYRDGIRSFPPSAELGGSF